MHWIRRVSCALVFLCAVPSFGNAFNAFSPIPLMFFSNSVRRDADAEEAKWVVYANGCAAFFLRNAMGLTFLGSAKHCFNYNPKAWCEGGGALRDNEGKKGKCTRIVATDSKHDIFVMEAKFDYVPDPEDTLQLSAKVPEKDTQLLMIGYPADPYRKAKLTVTENCWVLTGSVPSPHGGSISDRSSRHNCTTYGGNSGGPMLEKGTQTVVGLPFTYMPNDFHMRDPNNINTASHLAQMADFVSLHTPELNMAGIYAVN